MSINGNLIMDIDKAATQRVLEGVRQHGVIDLPTDPRCFIREALEEFLDLINYLRWASEKKQIALDDWLHINQVICYIIGVIEKSCPWIKVTEEEGVKNGV